MSLFDATNQSRTAFNTPATSRPATMMESLSSAYDVVMATERSDSFHEVEYDQFESYRDQIEELTGTRLYNPLDTHNASFMAEAPGGAEFAIEDWFKEVAELRKQHPGIPEITQERLLEDIASQRARVRARRQEVASRENALGNDVAAFLGASGAVLTDPIVLGSMLLGAPAATGIIRGALIEAGIGAASETVVQAGVQATRVHLDEGVDLQSAATNILLAGGGGLVGSAVLRGAGAGIRKLLERANKLPAEALTPEVSAAKTFLERLDEMQSQNPFGATSRGAQEHVARLDAAINRLHGTGRRANLSASTAVSRTLDDTAPRVTVEPIPIKHGEDVADFTARIRDENPELFKKLDTVDARITQLNAKVAKADGTITTPASDNIRLASQLETLQAQRTKAINEGADRRKLKRLDRKIADIVKQGDVTAKAKKELARASRAKTERSKAQAELKELTATKRSLDKEVTRVVSKTQPLSRVQTGFAARNIARQLPEADRAAHEEITALAAALADRVAIDAPLRARRGTRVLARSPEEIDPDLEKIVKDPAAIDEELRAAVQDTPDEVIEIIGDDGNLKTTTVRELAEDLDEDTQLFDEFTKCIREGR